MIDHPSCQVLPFGFCRQVLKALAVAPVALLLAVSVALAQADRFERAWPNTDFSRLAVDLGEVISGGPPRDGIPAILDPSFIRASDGCCQTNSNQSLLGQ